MRSDVPRASHYWLLRYLLCAVASMLVLATPAHRAFAAGDDAAVEAIVDKVLAEEYASAAFGDAQTKLMVE